MIKLSLHNDSDVSLDYKSIETLVNLIIESYKFPDGEVSLVIIDDDSLRVMKKEYLNQDYYTDVIAFNIEENPFEGEIYISYDRVRENAKIFNQDFEVEFKRVIIHGMLHLCGHEDSTKDEKIAMTKLENLFIDRFNNLLY